ncbi:MAG: 4Fe-4S dicluster domain-containing protein [Acidaminobacter sp.]|uniref:electron transfer flavoprotein subunit alpha n=1 Tax=Acidaminobacter sp. TaxID=1872102 RepID=UPI00137D8156|nr:electron transfer flavoprotein subunit alpha [Acidaminobacter sp.]MZQ98019.1 4Fe-4S dicluster domain-containing protein [Acidaminobacter sp.]
MTGLKIHQDKCVGCGLCVKTCAADALAIQNKKAVVNEACILCGMCLDSCPFKAISIEKQAAPKEDLSAYHGIWIYAEQQQGKILQVAYELLGKGQELAKQKGCKLTALLFGNDVANEAQSLIVYGADEVLLCEHPLLDTQIDENYIDLFDQLIQERKPEILLFGATGFGRSIAPRIAARRQTGLTADCTILDIDSENGLLNQTRPAFGGNLMATIICPNHRPQMATVRPGIMQVQPCDEAHTGEIIRVDYADPDASKTASVELLEQVIAAHVNTIADADIIISAGKGIGSQKNMELVKRLAELMGGVVGVSRPLVDIGWSEYQNQVGQTGSTVSPKLLITFGISGAIQHLAGISGAKTIIAVNTDPEAPIFSVAHYKVVADCVEILKHMIANLEARPENGLLIEESKDKLS